MGFLPCAVVLTALFFAPVGAILAAQDPGVTTKPVRVTKGDGRGAGTYTLWLPPAVPVLRGLVLCIDAREEWGALRWRRLAGECRLGLLLVQPSVPSIEDCGRWAKDGAASIKVALTEMATDKRRPELINVPWITLGWSRFGAMAHYLACLAPERVVAALPLGSCLGDILTGVPEDANRYASGVLTRPALGVPLLRIYGDRDLHFPTECPPRHRAERAQGGLRTHLITFETEHGGGVHWPVYDDLPVVWLREVLALRVPLSWDPKAGPCPLQKVDPATQGVIGLPDSSLTKPGPGAPADSSWLPGQVSAKLWAEWHRFERERNQWLPPPGTGAEPAPPAGLAAGVADPYDAVHRWELRNALGTADKPASLVVWSLWQKGACVAALGRGLSRTAHSVDVAKMKSARTGIDGRLAIVINPDQWLPEDGKQLPADLAIRIANPAAGAGDYEGRIGGKPHKGVVDCSVLQRPNGDLRHLLLELETPGSRDYRRPRVRFGLRAGACEWAYMGHFKGLRCFDRVESPVCTVTNGVFRAECIGGWCDKDERWRLSTEGVIVGRQIGGRFTLSRMPPANAVNTAATVPAPPAHTGSLVGTATYESPAAATRPAQVMCVPQQNRLGALAVGAYCVLAAVAPRPALGITTEVLNTCICVSTDSCSAGNWQSPATGRRGADGRRNGRRS
jgi:hypothetical protein